jgi:general secretion pathway protein K
LPRQAPFAHVNELGLVLSLPPALVERALPFVTVFSGAPGVDVLNAAPEVIAALPGMTPLVLKQFLNDRGSLPSDTTAIEAALGGAKGNAIVLKSQAYRLRVRVRFPNGQRAGSEVVISLSGDGDPYRVVSWQNEVGPRRPPAAQF